MPLLTLDMSMNTSIEITILKLLLPSLFLKRENTKPKVATLIQRDCLCVPLGFPCHFYLHSQIELLAWLNMNAASMVVLYSFPNLFASLVLFITRIPRKTKRAARQ
jgi:hypothetical protein